MGDLPPSPLNAVSPNCESLNSPISHAYNVDATMHAHAPIYYPHAEFTMQEVALAKHIGVPITTLLASYPRQPCLGYIG